MKTMCIAALTLVAGFAPASHASLMLASNGQARAVILADPAILAPDTPGRLPARAAEREAQRRRLRASIEDLSVYLEKIAGTPFPVVTNLPTPADGRLVIRVGAPAAAVFGRVGASDAFQQGFRVVADRRKGIGLFGESDLAASYAVYELLDRLGCRWFMPGDMGEVIPALDPLIVPELDHRGTPYTLYRGIWYADDHFKRRNRLGGLLLSAGHALEFGYITKDQLAQHPEWVAQYADGRPMPGRFKWSRADLADAIADSILEKQAADPRFSFSLSPDDGARFCESPEDRALDTGDFDTTCQTNSITDRFLVLGNRVAARVARKHPDLLLGFLAYVQYTRPPVREKVHPNLIPQIAPITYSRAHPMNMDEVPGNPELRAIVEGWGKKSRRTSYYFYAFNLAETLSPQPMLRKWAHDVPLVFGKGNCRFWQPETIPNFEVFLHAQYMGMRLAWDPRRKPGDVYAEINRLFYGAASNEMAAYWDFADRVWVETPEYSGCGFGHLRRWTPARLREARTRMNTALQAAQTKPEKFRVGLANDSLKLFESFMALRRDLAEGRWAGLGDRSEAWLQRVLALSEQYKDNYAFGRVGWTPHTIGGTYARSFYHLTHADAQRLVDTADILTQPPVRRFKYRADPDRAGEAAGWSDPAFADTDWPETDVSLETWSTLGRHDYFGVMWYRTAVTLAAFPAGRRVRLWLGATDGSARVFVNGRPAPHLKTVKGPDGTERTEPQESGSGYATPLVFDITDAARPGAVNHLAIRCERTFFNELGTGGLLGPAVIVLDRGE